MRRYAAIGLIFVVATGVTSKGYAQQCDLNRKTITFTITVCSQRGCKSGAERIDVLGEHVTHYSDANARVGTVYTLGRSVDLCADQTNAAIWAPRCSSADDIIKATANASYAGGELRLSVEQAFFKKQLNNLLYAKTVDLMRISVGDCQSCRVLDYTLTGTDQRGSRPLLTFGGSNSCQIGELSQ